MYYISSADAQGARGRARGESESDSNSRISRLFYSYEHEDSCDHRNTRNQACVHITNQLPAEILPG